MEILWAHKSLSISYVALFILYFLGIGEKYNAGQMYLTMHVSHSACCVAVIPTEFKLQ